MMPRLHIALVHYHARRGGVTTVMGHAARVLSDASHRVLVLVGEPPSDDPPPGTIVSIVHGLGYYRGGRPVRADALVERMERAAVAGLGRRPDLWHVHNHALGKNPALTEAVSLLALRGHRLLLQIHDFAEDGRPALYSRLLAYAARRSSRGAGLGSLLYPQAEQIHYATLNRRDRALLARAGVGRERLHELPNAVVPDPGDAEASPRSGASAGRRLFLYATRAIRRKNIGEFILWSALGAPGDRYGITLAPENPVERPVYDRWTKFVAGTGLPVEFGLGLPAPGALCLAELLRSAAAGVTTSVAEGFGLSFLEPFLAGRPVLGRRLPAITDEFERGGIDLSALYTTLRVPGDWVGAASLRTRIAARFRSSLAAYGRPCTGDDVERALGAALSDGRAEFARLDETLQEKTILRVAHSRPAAGEIEPGALWTGAADPGALARNRVLLREHYGLTAFSARLLAVYGALLGSPVEARVRGGIDPGILLDCFLAPESFFLLRA